MRVEVKIAKNKIKDHYAGTQGRTICGGEKYLQINNGTLGAGKRTYNFNRADGIKFLEGLLVELKRDDYPCLRCGEEDAGPDEDYCDNCNYELRRANRYEDSLNKDR